MTDFEKTIKREMTREKFLAIRDYKYGGDNDTFFDYTYGNVSSWLTWNRDEKGVIVKGNISEDYSIELKEAINESVRKRHFWDGPIDDWDQDKLLPPDRRITRKITSDIVSIGLNMSADGKPIPGPCFQNARGHKRIVKTFFGTEAEGAYFTDIIKPDKRILDNVEKKSNSQQLMQYIAAHRNVREEHVNLFKEELDFIGAKKPLLIIFGNNTEWILRQELDDDFLTEKFHAVVKIGHYSLANAVPGDDEGYKIDTRSKLKPYITIPLMNSNLSNLFSIMEQIVDQNGKSVFFEPSRVSAFLKDLARYEPDGRKTVLIKCLEQGFPKTLNDAHEIELARAKSGELAHTKRELAKRLHDKEGLDLKLCKESLFLLEVILFGDAPAASPEKSPQRGE